jgi:uncharacterized membrane protein
MLTTVVSTEVNVPVRTAYHQWTQFEDFPQFMEGVRQVTQLDAKRLHWKAEIAGKEKEWVAKIIEQTPDKRIAWTSRVGGLAEAMVTFHSISDAKSQILLRVGCTTEGGVHNVRDGMSAVSSRLQRDLERFKVFIEQRYREIMAGPDLRRPAPTKFSFRSTHAQMKALARPYTTLVPVSAPPR